MCVHVVYVCPFVCFVRVPVCPFARVPRLQVCPFACLSDVCPLRVGISLSHLSGYPIVFIACLLHRIVMASVGVSGTVTVCGVGVVVGLMFESLCLWL